MSKTDLGDVCGRFLSSRLFKDAKSSLTNEHVANEHKHHAILSQKLLFKPYKKNPLEQLRKRYSNIALSITNEIITKTVDSQPKEKPAPANHSADSSVMMNWKLLKDRGSGLINLGNTCFINASLQCLANTPPLVQWLLSNSHHQHCRIKLEKQFCLFCEAERIVKLIHSKHSYASSASPANPNNIVRRIRDISKTFRFGRQEDASEFLICLIDKIIEACLRSSQPPQRLRPSSGTSYEQLCHSQTFLHELFGLVLRSRVLCSRCRHTSDTFEVQYTWLVSVRNQNDLRNSLQQFVCRESLAGENAYRCIQCKQLVPAVKRYTLHKASKILLINLKRFEFGKNSHKLSHLVRYPEFLNVKPYMSEDNANGDSLNYRLYAVLVHVGSSMHSGHYFSYVRSPNNRWYKADDSTMTQCDVHQVLTQHGAYILCYIKESESPASNDLIHEVAKSTLANISQNGKLNHVEQKLPIAANTSKFFIPRPLNLPRQIVSGLNGHAKAKAEPASGNGIISAEKQNSTTAHCSKASSSSDKSTQNNEYQSSVFTSKQMNKSNGLLSTANSNHSTNSELSDCRSVVNSSNDSHESEQPVRKKQRLDDSSNDGSTSPAESSTLSLKKKKEKHKHNHHLHSSMSKSLSFVTGEQYQQPWKHKKNHMQRPFSLIPSVGHA